MSLKLPASPVNSILAQNNKFDVPFKDVHQPRYVNKKSKDKRMPHSTHWELPTTYHNPSNDVLRVEDDLGAYLRHELLFPRLDKIHKYLFVAGRPMAARALHRQVMMNRTVVITENIDMHLLWVDGSIFIKPLPDYLLHCSFWSTHLVDEDLHSHALGLLTSYLWLVSHPSDLKIAQDTGLLPKSLTWTDWISLSSHLSLTVDMKSMSGLPPRYKYGELRLARINTIYRLNPAFKFQYCVRGYFYQYREYGTFFQRNFGWILTLFAFLSVVLSGLQVGLGTNGLVKEKGFQDVSYWAAVLSLGIAAALPGSIALLFLFFFLDNLRAAVVFFIKQGRRRAKANAEAKKGIP